MRRFICALILTLLPTAAFAQHKRPGVIYVRHANRDCCYGNRFSLEPYGGVIKDAFDVSPDDKNTSALVGLRLGYQLGWRTRLLANVGYSKSDDVANPQGLPAYFIYDNTWVFTTGGAEFDVVPGRTSAALGLQAGAAWRRVDLDGQVGTPLGTSQEDSGFHASDVIVPSLTLRHRISNRLAVSAGVHDNIFDVFDGPAKHGLATTFGVAFR